MILCPLENTAVKKNGEWAQFRPIVTQGFGENPHIYRQFGLAGHNGIDFRASVGTPVFAPMDAEVTVTDQGDKGYGLFVRLRSHAKALEIVLGHLDRVRPGLPKKVNMGDLLGWTGNTGFSTGPHLHVGVRQLMPSLGGIYVPRFPTNGFAGYADFDFVTFKGTIKKNSLAD